MKRVCLLLETKVEIGQLLFVKYLSFVSTFTNHLTQYGCLKGSVCETMVLQMAETSNKLHLVYN